MILRLLLGDQLNHRHSWFRTLDPEVIYVLMELRQETDYVDHHIQKVVAFFTAMRAFSKRLESEGHRIHYIKIGDPQNKQSLVGNLEVLMKKYTISHFQYQLPDEYRLDRQLIGYCSTLQIPFTVYDTEHFLTTRNELQDFFRSKKQVVMEFFYRYMRKKFSILMNGDQPKGGRWNFDNENRKAWKGLPPIPSPFEITIDVTSLLEDIRKAKIKMIGNIDSKRFTLPTTYEGSKAQLNYFCQYLLPYFGDYQDAMHTEQSVLFHSRLSFALNIKLISPLEVVQTVLNYYEKNKQIELSQTEGFIRQIIGWREYMRGIYWREMPGYTTRNYLKNSNPLPNFYWNGRTKMQCMQSCIVQSLEEAYAHHIQRLMITGNFALLAQVDPNEVDRWYLGIYIDAIQWVQLTNTRGMSQFADGGLLATKPYISSSNYINKMSNYCQNCSYNQKERIGKNACPFNSLYWSFLEDKRAYLQANPRMTMMYRLLDKISSKEMELIRSRAQEIRKNPDDF